MNYFLIITSIIFMLAGLIGCVLPVLPGPVLSFAGLLLLHFTENHQFTGRFLVIWALITATVTLADYFIPVWSAKKSGAGRAGIWGGVIGLLVGLIFFPPFGVIVGPLAGAVTGELMAGKSSNRAFKTGIASFVGFTFGTLLKLMVSGMMTWYFLKMLIV